MAASFNGRIMDTTTSSDISTPDTGCSAAELAALLSTPGAPLIIDVRRNEAFGASGYLLPGALRRDPLQADTWANALPKAAALLVYCVHGHEVSQSTAALLCQRGFQARFLQGGIAAWRDQGLGLQPKPTGAGTRWVTRERPKIDRIACPWLLRRFVDDQAQFLYVPAAQVRATALEKQATAYDVSPDLADTAFTHDGALCSFDAFMRIYGLGADTALVRLAEIVRAADTDHLELAPQAAGLLAVSLGMSRTISDDLAMLDAMMPVYDALYAWCRDAVAGTDEKHNWKPA
jgi:rhodanese-related sulfurtransferase